MTRAKELVRQALGAQLEDLLGRRSVLQQPSHRAPVDSTRQAGELGKQHVAMPMKPSENPRALRYQLLPSTPQHA